MPRKVLISFLGTGRKVDARAYNQATYRFDDGNKVETSFIADALVQKYNIQNVVLLGTPHSMWENVYETFCKRNNTAAYDDNYYYELGIGCDNANHNTPLEINHKEKIEEALGGDSHVVLLRYGITEEEIKENVSIIMGIEQYLHDRDELIVDITHSFRSLPLYIMNLLLYLKNVSSKRIRISQICYGMLDVTSEFGYTPVVFLNGIMDVQDWITGAYNFMEFGNTYKIAQLLERENCQDAARRLRNFAEAKNLNRLREFRNNVNSLNPLMDEQRLPDVAKIFIPEIIGKFTNRFPAALNEYTYQFRMAEWHKRRHNYGYALINLVESALSFCCELIPDRDIPAELVNVDMTPRAKRDIVRRCLNYANDDQDKESIENLRSRFRELMEPQGINFCEFNRHYDEVNRDRNTIAHDLDRGNYLDILTHLEEGIEYFRGCIQQP